jgi:hypothetical protein
VYPSFFHWKNDFLVYFSQGQTSIHSKLQLAGLLEEMRPAAAEEEVFVYAGSQSNDRDLQRQRCKFLQRDGQPGVF